MKNKGLIIAAGLLAVVLLCNTAGNFMIWQKVNRVYDSVKQEEEEASGETREDDVTIAGEYEIRSTLPISDAYKSGDTSGLSDREKETLDMAADVLDQIITDDMSDFDKEKAVYDWMCSNLGADAGLLTVIPTSGEDSDNPYGVLKNHNAVCVGYATTFRLFMQMMDIECMVVHNNDCYHSWDLVKIDGDWYHTDIYSDVEKGNYAHFNQNDLMRSKDQSWDMSFYPSANALTCNIAFQKQIAVSDLYQIPKTVREQIKEKNLAFCMSFEQKIDEDAARIGNAVCEQLQSAMWSLDTSRFNYSIENYYWLPDGDSYVLYVSVNANTVVDEGKLDQETSDRITEAIDSAFGDLMNGTAAVTEDTGKTGAAAGAQ